MMAVELNIRVIELKPIRVASCRAVGGSPEKDAINMILNWADKKGLLKESGVRLFGFNNPGPRKGETEYGYEVWLTVGPDIEGSGDVQIRDFTGGLYAAKRTDLPQIGQAWKDIIEWRKTSRYAVSSRQCLEEHIAPKKEMDFDSLILDVLLPIEIPQR